MSRSTPRPTSRHLLRSLHYASSPLLASKTPPWRSRFVVLLVGAAFAVLLGRAVYVQIVATQFFQAKGAERFVHRQTLAASRGRILDRHGQVLATSVAMPTVRVDMRLFAADDAQRKALAQALSMSRVDLEERLESGSATVTLRRHVEEPVWLQVKALAIKGVFEEREFRRRYPEGEAAAQVVGFTDVDDAGQAGIELTLDDELKGTPGQRTVVRDRLGRVVEEIDEPVVPRNGHDVTLSIDAKIQFEAFKRAREAVKAHNAASASVVVLDTVSGEVLAMANYPSFDPAQRRTGKNAAAMGNRALIDAMEPGSTMKPFTIATALETGRFSARTMIDTAPGRIQITGSTISDAHPHGTLSLAEVLQKSSNVGTVKVAMQLERRELWDTYAAVGFGSKPRIEAPSVSTGRLRAWKNWRPVEHATAAYGYGLSASVLQMARAYTVFARDGEVLPVTLIKRDAGQSAGPVAGQRVFSPATAQQVREMLKAAASPGGTASDLQRSTLGYSVAGKTGTAKKQVGREYAEGKYRAWFVGLAPVSAPRIVVAVMVDEPRAGKYYAGEVAAPVFSQVVQNTLRLMAVPPDVDVKTQIAAKPVASEAESL
jgi:cell division protein FtsI (penicillin-binding protein 3)